MKKNLNKFVFKITEYGISGKSERAIEVEAKTLKSAKNKVYAIQGNRTWDVVLLGREIPSAVCDALTADVMAEIDKEAEQYLNSLPRG